MMFNQIVIQEEAMHIVKDFDINYQAFEDGLYPTEAPKGIFRNTKHA